MKKLLITLVFLFIPIISFSQSFLRAYDLNIGYKNSYGKIEWAPESTPVNILIKAESSKVTIFSKRTQIYRVVSLLEQTETKSKWLCNDDNGVTCHVFIFTLETKPGIIFVGVEYNDMTWFYSTTAE
jgi:hypothetical protein